MTALIESATTSQPISIPSPHSIQRLDACIKSPARLCLTAPYHIEYCLSSFLLRRPAASRPCQKYRVCMYVKSNACSVRANPQALSRRLLYVQVWLYMYLSAWRPCPQNPCTHRSVARHRLSNIQPTSDTPSLVPVTSLLSISCLPALLSLIYLRRGRLDDLPHACSSVASQRE
jgi:hypothetical protein